MNKHLLGAAALVLASLIFNPAWAQEGPAVDRTAIGGAQTLEDIMRSQAKQKLVVSFRSENLGNPAKAAPITEQLGTRGGVSVSVTWRAIRFSQIDPTVQSPGPANGVMIHDGGISCYKLPEAHILTLDGGALPGIIVLLVVL